MWARTGVDDKGKPTNIVEELFDRDPTGTIFAGFRIVEVAGPYESFVQPGYTVNEAGEFFPPTVQFLVDQMLAVTANKRWSDQQITRIVHNGVSFFADEQTRANVSQNLQVAERMERAQKGSFSSRWKTPEGYVVLNYTDMEAVGMKLAAAVQAQFDREGDVTELVQAADDTAEAKFEAWRDAMDDAWPTPTFEEPAASATETVAE